LLAAWLSLPLLGSLAVGFLYVLMSKEEIRNFVEIYLFGGSRQELTGISLGQAYVHDVSHVVFALLVLGVMVTGIRKIRRYNLKLQDLYADTEDKQLNGISVILWLFVVTSFFSVAVNAVGRPSFDHSLLLAIPSLLFSSLLFGICWIGLESHSFSDEMERNDALVIPNSGVPESSGTDFALLARQFNQLMTDEQMYLMHDLRLDFVVQRLGTNRTYLLAALKQELGMTFNEYVNRRRIAHARQLMKANPSILKSDVAARSGYNSLSAFYRNLKNLSD
jgi:AraC-like DNA-binding protein